MKYIASCSGGKDSVATILLALEHREPLDEVVYCEVMFSPKISGEVPEHREFIYSKFKPFVESKGIPFVVLHSKKTYMDVFHHVRCRGKSQGYRSGFAIPGMCEVNRDCKIPSIREYWKNIGKDVVQYVGIAPDEDMRLAKLAGTNMISLLGKYAITEPEAKKMCKAANLLSPIYEFCRRNGCWFCPNASDNEFSNILFNHPDLFDMLMDLENKDNIYRRCITRTETPSQLKHRLEQSAPQTCIDEYLEYPA